MANDRNAGMNIPILFKQVITKYHAISDFDWTDDDKVADFLVGLRDSISSTPEYTDWNLSSSDYWWEDEISNVWFTNVFNHVKPVSVTMASQGGALVLQTSVDDVESGKYFWRKGSGLYVYNSGSKPTDVVVRVQDDAAYNLYALTDFGLNSEELLNSPNMDVDEGFYSFIENIPELNLSAQLRTLTLSEVLAGMIRYTMGNNGFFNSFLYERQTRPDRFLKYENNFSRKYIAPRTDCNLEHNIGDVEDHTLGGFELEWDENINVICSSRVKDLESIKYGDNADFATEVWDPRNRAFAIGVQRLIEYTGSGTAISSFMKWAIALVKVNGKVQDWVKVLSTTDNGNNYTDETSDMNLKNDGNITFGDSTNDWVAFASNSRLCALTLKFSNVNGASARREVDVQILTDEDWQDFTASEEGNDTTGETHDSHYNTTNYFQMKTVGDFYTFPFYDQTWTKQTLDGTEAYWLRIKPIAGAAGDKLAWAVNSGPILLDEFYSGTIIKDKLGTWADDCIGFVPLSLKYVEDKKQLWGTFYDLTLKYYFPFCIQFNRDNINDSGKRSWDVKNIKIIDNYDKYDLGRKFHSYAISDYTRIYSDIVDDKNPKGTIQIAKFPADFNGSEIFQMDNEYFIGKYKGRIIYGDNYDSINFWDGKTTFSFDNGGPTEFYISCSAEYGGNLYFGRIGSTNIYKFDGKSVTTADTVTGVNGISQMAVMGDYLYIGTNKAFGQAKIFRWDGTTLTDLHDVEFSGGPNVVMSMIVYDSKLFIGTTNSYIEMYDGSSWTTERNTDLASYRLTSFFNLKGSLYAIATNTSGADYIFKRTNSTGVWTQVYYSATPYFSWYYSQNKVFVEGGDAYIGGTDGTYGVLYRFNGEDVFEDAFYLSRAKYIESIAKLGDTYYCAIIDVAVANISYVTAYNFDDFTIEKELIGGEGNLVSPMKTNFAQTVFPQNTSSDLLKKSALCGFTNNRGVVWEYSNIKNLYINVHSTVNKRLSDLIRDLTIANNSVFYTSHDGILTFKNKNIKGLADSVYTLSNYTDYGEGVIKSLADIGLYENIINKVKVAWNNNIFGNGTTESGIGVGIGKQISISNDIIDDEYKANAISNNIFSNYANIREFIKLEAILLFFLELSDVVKIKVAHPRVYIDSTKEWLLSGYDLDINSLTASYEFIERLLEE